MSCEIQPARHNHQPTHQQGTEEACMAWPKLTKNANFGPNLVVFGQKILFFTGEIKSFVTHITENPPRHLVHIVDGNIDVGQERLAQEPVLEPLHQSPPSQVRLGLALFANRTFFSIFIFQDFYFRHCPIE